MLKKVVWATPCISHKICQNNYLLLFIWRKCLSLSYNKLSIFPMFYYLISAMDLLYTHLWEKSPSIVNVPRKIADITFPSTDKNAHLLIMQYLLTITWKVLFWTLRRAANKNRHFSTLSSNRPGAVGMFTTLFFSTVL